jgi:hypothetical protein
MNEGQPKHDADVDAHNPKQTGALGGKARAARMTSEERSAAASRAAKANWNIPRATHEGVFEFGPIKIDCAVLNSGTRVVSERAFLRALGRANAGGQTYARRSADGGHADQLPIYLALRNLKPVIPMDFLVPTIRYRSLDNRTVAIGIRAESIPDVCDIWIEAKERKLLREGQLPTARAASIISRGLSRVGIIGLIDEVTGYEKVKIKDDLQKTLRDYIVEAMRPWISRFPEEFFRQIYRLHGWAYREGNMKRPGYVAHVINEAIYRRLPAPVLPKLQELNPVVDGRRKAKHHQFLTENTGIPHLDDQIAHVTTLMRAAVDKRMFDGMLKRAFPQSGDQLSLATVDAPPA